MGFEEKKLSLQEINKLSRWGHLGRRLFTVINWASLAYRLAHVQIEKKIIMRSRACQFSHGEKSLLFPLFLQYDVIIADI